MLHAFCVFLAVLSLSSIGAAGTLIPLDADAGEGFDRESDADLERARQQVVHDFRDSVWPEMMAPKTQEGILRNYEHLDPGHEIPQDLLRRAVVFFDANRTKFRNQQYLAVLDYGARSDRARFFLVNLRTGVVHKYHTTHGHGSDQDRDGWAEQFSNIPNSGMSSLGFVRTGEVYHGKYGRSLRLDGLSSTNSLIRSRAVVIHGWKEAVESDVIQGLSWGCPAFDNRVKDRLIDQVRGGALLYFGVAGSSQPPL